jgi:hypothetical protein
MRPSSAESRLGATDGASVAHEQRGRDQSHERVRGTQNAPGTLSANRGDNARRPRPQPPGVSDASENAEFVALRLRLVHRLRQQVLLFGLVLF